MTIHLVDGFLWGTEKSNPTSAQVLSDFIFPNALRAAVVGKGLRHFNRSGDSSTRSSIITTEKIPLRDKLVVGVRLQFSTVPSSYGAYVVIHPTNVESHNTANAVPYSVADAGFIVPGLGVIPTFVVGRNTEASQYRISFLTSNRATEAFMQSTVSNNVITATESTLAGVDMSASVMFEAEYDFSENKIRAYVDDSKVLDFDYMFSQREKSDSKFQLQLSNKGSSSIGSIQSTTRVECIYFADYRLGPVRLEDLPLDTDVDVSSGFGEGPHADKINGDADGSSFIATKESGTAKFSSSVQANGDIVAVKVTAKARTQHRSANETYAGYQLTLGETLKSTLAEIPSNGYRTHSTVLDINPDTGLAWSDTEINALAVGVDLSVRPRFE